MSLPVLVLFGQTACGKTELLDRVFGSPSTMEGEVVSADSMQAYRGMDIGTAKPDSQLLSRLPHHLIDILDPHAQYNAGDFVRLADTSCLDIHSRSRIPVVSGGTGFYLKNFILGPSEAPPSDPQVREAIRGELESRGLEALRAELESVDSVSAGRIHPHDVYRLTRALEVFRVSGRPLSSFAENATSAPANLGRGEDTGSRPQYRLLLVGVTRPQGELYRRINLRCEAMFRSGLRREVEGLVAKGYGPDSPGMRAIGYREFFRPDGTICPDDDLVLDAVAKNTRHYAKRQRVFFSSASLRDVVWIDLSDEVNDPVSTLRSLVQTRLLD